MSRESSVGKYFVPVAVSAGAAIGVVAIEHGSVVFADDSVNQQEAAPTDVSAQQPDPTAQTEVVKPTIDPSTHQVSVGDTVESIAASNGLTADELIQANGGNTDPMVGSILNIPKPNISPNNSSAKSNNSSFPSLSRDNRALLPSLNIVEQDPTVQAVPVATATPNPVKVDASQNATSPPAAATPQLAVVENSGVIVPKLNDKPAQSEKPQKDQAIEKSKNVLDASVGNSDPTTTVTDTLANAAQTIVAGVSNLISSPEKPTIVPGLQTVVLPDKRVMHIQPGVKVKADPDGTLTITAEAASSSDTSNLANKAGDTPTQVTAPPATSAAPAETKPAGSYREYLDGMTSTPEPADVTELKKLNVSKDNGLQKRSAAYPTKMEWLKENTTQYVTTDAYQRFKANGIDTSLASKNIFGPELKDGGIDMPNGIKCFVLHWTAGMTNSAENAAHVMLNRSETASVQVFTLSDGTVAQITPHLETIAFHGGPLVNYQCTASEDMGNDLLDFTPQVALSNIMMTAYLHLEKGMPLERDVAASEGKTDKYNDNVMPDFTSAGTVLAHKDIPDSHKIDPTDMYVNYVYEQAQILVNLIKNGEAAMWVSNPPSSTTDPNPTLMGGILQADPPAVGGVGDTIAFLGDVAPAIDDGQPLGTPTATAPSNSESTGDSTETIATVPLGKLHAHDFPYLTLLDPTSLDYQCSAEDAVTKSQQGPVFARQNATLFGEDAYGHQFKPYEMYLFHYNSAIEDGDTPDQADSYATSMLDFTIRESGGYSCIVGDLVPDANGKLAFSYGPSQQRNDSDEAIRDPQANVDPIQSARNARQLWKRDGFSPWDTKPVSDSIKATAAAGREQAQQLLNSMQRI